MSSPLRIADRTFASRLFTGTGKYASAAALRAVLDADQHLGGSIGWAMGEIPIVVALIATFIQWVKDDSRESKRIDRAADRAEASGSEDEHTRYNAYLAELARRDEQIKKYE